MPIVTRSPPLSLLATRGKTASTVPTIILLCRAILDLESKLCVHARGCWHVSHPPLHMNIARFVREVPRGKAL